MAGSTASPLETAPELPRPISVVDVAEYILRAGGEMPTMKLQQLVYLSQGWHLAATGVRLFDEEIQAWAEGPVVPALYALHENESIVGPGFFYEKLRARDGAIAAPKTAAANNRRRADPDE